MLQQPRTHVRQRSVGKTEIELEEKRLRPEAPLLDEKEVHEDERTYIPTRTRRTNATLAVLWAASIMLAVICTYAVVKIPTLSSYGSLEKGYTTDLDDARSVIKVQRQQFHGSLDFKARHGFIPEDSPSQKYIGSSPEVDEEWEELTKDRYFLLSDAEAAQAYRGDNITAYWNEHHGGYVAGLDVLHTLHCLNHLRKTLYPKAYPMDPQNTVTHSAHCLDHLRQLAMCYGDLTAIPTQYFPGLMQNYINSSREHTCRNFEMIRDWATERFNGSTAVKARNRDGKLKTMMRRLSSHS